MEDCEMSSPEKPKLEQKVQHYSLPVMHSKPMEVEDIENKRKPVKKSEYCILDRKYEVMESLGDGHTSRVYLGRELNNP